MPKADCVHSTPPTNTAIASLMKQPAMDAGETSSSRRQFLQKAAMLAAASAAGGVTAATALPAPASAAVAPIGDLDSFVAPAIHEAKDEVFDAFFALHDCQLECAMRDKAVRKWEARNPVPVYLLPDDEGYSPTARSDHSMRKQNVMIQLELGKIKKERGYLLKVYNAAVLRLACLEAFTPAELFIKAGVGTVVDNADASIAKSVMRDLENFRDRLFPSGVRA